MLHVTQPTGEPALVAELLQREDQRGATAHLGEGQALEGKKVRKKFGRKFYSGTILAFEPDTKWYKVEYEDGDTEELEWPELEPILAPGDDKKSPRSRKRRGAGGSNQKSGKKSRKTTKGAAAVNLDVPATATAAEPLDLNETVGVPEQEHGGDANQGGVAEHGGDAQDGDADHAGGADREDHGRSTDHGIAAQQEGGTDHDEHEQAPDGEVVEAEEGAVEDNEVEAQAEPEKKPETKKKSKKKAVKRKGKSPNKRAKTATGVKEPIPEPVEVKSPSKRGKRKVEVASSAPVPKKVKETKQTLKATPSKQTSKATPPKQTPKATPSDKKSKKAASKAAKEKAAAKGKTVHDESMVEHSPFSPTDRGSRLKGRKFKKDFDGKLYSGEIADYDRKTRFYKVLYEDGDEEELEWRELEPLMEPLEEAGTSERQEPVVKPSTTVLVRKTQVVLEQRRVTRATQSTGRKSTRQR